MEIRDILSRLGIDPVNSGACHGDWLPNPTGSELASMSPATGATIATVRQAGPEDYRAVLERASQAFLEWRTLPAPRRGDVVREIGNELRRHKDDLGALVSAEMGKIPARGPW